jgi:hypothetical protein
MKRKSHCGLALSYYSVVPHFQRKGIAVKPEQLQFEFKDAAVSVRIASNDNPPVDAGPSDDEQGESATVLVLPTRKAVPRSWTRVGLSHLCRGDGL